MGTGPCGHNGASAPKVVVVVFQQDEGDAIALHLSMVAMIVLELITKQENAMSNFAVV